MIKVVYLWYRNYSSDNEKDSLGIFINRNEKISYNNCTCMHMHDGINENMKSFIIPSSKCESNKIFATIQINLI